MQENKKTPIIESIREYVKSYPGINNRKINIDYLGDGMEYSIDPIGADPIYKKQRVLSGLRGVDTTEQYE